MKLLCSSKLSGKLHRNTELLTQVLNMHVFKENESTPLLWLFRDQSNSTPIGETKQRQIERSTPLLPSLLTPLVATQNMHRFLSLLSF